MMLRTSSNSINPALQMVKITLLKNLGLIILSVAIVLLVCPVYTIVDLKSITYAEDYIYLISEWIQGLTVFAVAIGLVGTFIYSAINLSYMFSKKSSDVFHSVPLIRGELLFSRAFSGLISTLIPIIVLFASLMILNAAYGYTYLYAEKILLCFAFVVASTFVFWSLSIMFSICAGAVFDYLLSYIGVNLGLFLMSLIVHKLLDNYLLGYTDNNPVYMYFSPIYYCFTRISRFLNNNMDTKEIITFFVISIILTSVFYTVTYLLYKKRKAERTGRAYAYQFVYLLCGFIITFCTAYGVGYMLSGGEINTVVFWIIAVIGALIAAVAYSAITNRSFKNFKSALLLGTVSVAIMGVITLLMFVDPLGFSKKIPKETEIESATLQLRDYPAITYTDNNLPLELHKKIIDEKLALRGENTTYDYTDVDIVYTLKNGKTFSRSYTVLEEDIKQETLKNYISDEHINMYYDKLLEINPEKIAFYFSNITTAYHGTISVNDFKQLLRIYNEEVKTAGNVLANSDFSAKRYFQAHWYSQDNYEYQSTASLCFTVKCEKTKKYLELLIDSGKLVAYK